MSTDLQADGVVIIQPELGYGEWSARLRVATPAVVELEPASVQQLGDEWHVVFSVSDALLGKRYELVIIDSSGSRSDVRYGTIVAGSEALRVELAQESPISRQFVHRQDTASASWTIVHGRGDYPHVTVVDSSGRQVYGDVTYPDNSTVQIDFAAPFSGRAYLGD